MARVMGFWGGLCGLLLAIAIAYSNSLGGVFFFDDFIAIVENPSIRNCSDALFPPREIPVAGRPIANLTLAINYSLHRLEPAGYHLFNIAIHLANTVWVALLVRTLLSLYSPGQPSVPLSLGIASVWALHPLLTEAVDYTTQRTELLVSFCALISIWATGMYWKSKSGWWNLLGMGACFLGLLAKETAAMIPLIVPLVDRVASQMPWQALFRVRIKVYAGYLTSWGLLLAMLSSNPRSDSVGTKLGVSPWEYLSTQCWVIPRYLSQVFWPTGLCIDYGTDTLPLAQTWPGGVLLVLMFACACWAVLRSPGLGFLLGSFFVWLAPTSSFLPIITEVGAERRMYLPLLSIVTICLIAIWKWLPSKIQTPAFLAVSLLLSGVMGSTTYQRNVIYHSRISIWQDAVKKLPHNFRAHYNLALALQEAGREAEAIPHYRTALERMTHDRLLSRARTLTQLAVLLSKRGDTQEALVLVNQARRETLATADVHVNIAVVLAGQGNLAEAEQELRRAIKIKADNAPAHANLGMILASQGKRIEAEQHLAKAVELQPQLMEAQQALKQIQAGPAPSQTATASGTTPRSAGDWIQLGSAARQSGELAKAMECYEQAIKVDPHNAAALNSLGALLARPEPQRAIELYQRAIAANPDFVEAYFNLGTLLARAGHLSEAIVQYESALRINPAYEPAQKNLQVVRGMLAKKSESESH